MTTLAQALATSLCRHVDHAFTLMGNGNAHLIDELGKRELPISPVRHEAATVASADAYARITGRLALASATYGAGFTNTLTALAEAAQARTPLLLVVGDAPTSGARPWDIDQELAAAAVGVRSYPVRPDTVTELVDRAADTARRHRRPVVLTVPYDLVTAELEPAGIDLGDAATIARLAASTRAVTPGQDAPDALASAAQPPTVSPAEISAAAHALAAAKRPLVLAGRGAWLAGVATDLDAIAERLGALTASTALAQGIFDEDRYHLGITGGFGQPAAMRLINQADVVLAVGASLNQFTMRFGELFGADTTLVRVDTEQLAAPATAQPIDYRLLQGDAAEVLPRLLSELTRHPASPWRNEAPGLEADGTARRRDHGSEHPDGLCADGLLDPRAVAARIATLLPERRQVTSDGGHFIGWANMFWPVASPERMIMVGTAYQTIGLGLATVAGAAAAAPDHTVVVTTGDGGALMSLPDLETAIRVSRSCVIVVWNDAAYGAEMHLYGALGLDQTTMRIATVDFAGIATALGATGVRVQRLADLDALARWRAAGATGTLLLDCRISRSVVAPYQREVQRVNGLPVEADHSRQPCAKLPNIG